MPDASPEQAPTGERASVSVESGAQATGGVPVESGAQVEGGAQATGGAPVESGAQVEGGAHATGGALTEGGAPARGKLQAGSGALAGPAIQVPPSGGDVRRSWNRHRTSLAMLAGAFVVSRLAAWAAGVGFDAVALHPATTVEVQWQLLPPNLLRHQLVGSVWHLASQPPLYNLAVGLLLRLPVSAQAPVAALAMASLGLAAVLAAYGAMIDLRVPRWLAAAAGLLLVASPDALVYERWLFYAAPTAAFLALTLLAGTRLARTERTAWAVAFFAFGATVVLTNSSYQWVWWVAASAPVVWVLRHRWRRLVLAAAVPVVLVGGWYVKDAAQFGTATTSSWLGMNLARTTVAAQPPALVRSLVVSGVLSPLAMVTPFSPVAAYVPRFVAAPRPTGVAALDQRHSAVDTSNFDNLAYVAVAERYLGQDLRFIRAEPGRYADAVGRAVAVWSLPGDDYPFVASLVAPVSGYARAWDMVVGWQVQAAPRAGYRALAHQRAPSPLQVSWSAVLVTVLAVAGAPVVALLDRRRDRAKAAGLALASATVAYAFVLTSLVELGENNRFRMELGPLPLVATVVTVVAIARWVVARRRSRARSDVVPG